MKTTEEMVDAMNSVGGSIEYHELHREWLSERPWGRISDEHALWLEACARAIRRIQGDSTEPAVEQAEDIDVHYVNPGSKWYVKLRDARGVMTQEIVEITGRTVLMEDIDKNHTYGRHRYMLSDIEFVEEIK